VSSREEANHRFLRAFEGEPQGEIISFETPALLLKVLTQKRWELLSMMTGAGPITLREAARRVERDVKAVHGDVHALLNAGILQKTEEGRIVFPFDAVRQFRASGGLTCAPSGLLERGGTSTWG
jgi:predicted transcriptional regulator